MHQGEEEHTVPIDVVTAPSLHELRHGFGGVKMTGSPLPQCKLSVERAYDGSGQAFECVNPGFFEPPHVDEAFDLRDSL